MRDKLKELRRLKELREELTALTRRSLSTLTEIAKIQVRIQELTDRLLAVPPKKDSKDG
jgi:hypothetical protein